MYFKIKELIDFKMKRIVFILIRTIAFNYFFQFAFIIYCFDQSQYLTTEFQQLLECLNKNNNKIKTNHSYNKQNFIKIVQ